MVDQAAVSHGPATERVVDREEEAVAAHAHQPGTLPVFTLPGIRQVLTAPIIRLTSGRKARTLRQTTVAREAVRHGPSSELAAPVLQFPACLQDYKPLEQPVTAQT